MDISDVYRSIAELHDAHLIAQAVRTPRHRRAMDVRTAYRATSGDVQQQLGEIWKEVLCIDEVGCDDLFFELGGDSLLMVQVLNRIRARLDADITIDDFFEGPTVGQLAEAVIAARAEAPEEDHVAVMLAQVTQAVRAAE